MAVSFLNSFLSYLVVLVVIAVVGAVAITLGITLRKKKNAAEEKKQTEEYQRNPRIVKWSLRIWPPVYLSIFLS